MGAPAEGTQRHAVPVDHHGGNGTPSEHLGGHGAWAEHQGSSGGVPLAGDVPGGNGV
jgi:hypothetical protein